MKPGFSYAPAFLRAFWGVKILKQRIPFFVSWALTYRCNSCCRYCDVSALAGKELDFNEISHMIDVLKKRGTHILSLTGGEPLLRDDIGKIIHFARKRGLCVKLNTNGSLVVQKIKELQGLSALGISFDGPEPLHDSLRGLGSYAGVMRAVETAKKHDIPAAFLTVISDKNLNSIADILACAEKLKIKVLFQPATQMLYGGTRPNPVVSAINKYREAIDGLIRAKKKGAPHILNSAGGLALLRQWPDPVEIQCVNGLLGCRIEPDGQVCLCSWLRPIQNVLGKTGQNFETLFDALPLNIKCHNCWCAAQIELNRLAGLKWDAIGNVLNWF